MSIIDSVEYCTEQWRKWQADVVGLVRRELSELSHSIHGDDFDWDAWRSYFDVGYLPIDAVKQALSLQSSSDISNAGDSLTRASTARMQLQVE